MSTPRFLSTLRVLWLTAGVLLLDQVTKLAVRGVRVPFLGIDHAGMPLGHSIPLIGSWLKLTFIENPNMAFGLDLAGKLFLALFALLASIGIVWYLWRHDSERPLLRLALALVLAGALGNLVDRIFYGVLFGYGSYFQGNVVDFVDVDLFTIHFGSSGFKFWPIFNVADAAVSVGVVMLLILSRPARQPAAAASVTDGASAAAVDPTAPDAGAGAADETRD